MIIQGIEIHWLGHDGYKIISDNRFIYIDPFRIPQNMAKADYVFITHGHYDHCSIEDLKKLAFENTTVICTPDVVSKLHGLKIKEVKTVAPGQSLSLEGIEVETVPAYNVNKFRSPGVPFHPKEQDWVGYILTIQGKRLYHAGDTDRIPEMQQVQDIDIAFLPVSGTYVMDAREAAGAVEDIKPETAIPMHYDEIVGKQEDADLFAKMAGCEVIFLDKGS